MKRIKDNRWHILEKPNNIFKAGYIEWKYFNFSNTNLSGVFVYSIFDPLNKTGIGSCTVAAKIFTPSGVFGGVKKILPAEANFSAKNAECEIKKNRIKIKNNAYKIEGKINDVDWSLEYSPIINPIEAFTNFSLDPLKIGKLSWFIAIPKARVKGIVKISGEKFNIDTFGYSDANWGATIPLLAQFNWAQYNDKNLSLVIGEMYNFELFGKKIGRWGKIYINWNDKQIIFKKNNFSIKHLKWESIPKNHIKFPRLTLLEAENKNYKLSLTLKTIALDLFYLKMPLHFPLQPLVIEQTAEFKGTLIKKEKNKNVILYSIKGNGFKEYSLRNLSFNNHQQKNRI